MLVFISFDTFDIGYLVQPCTIAAYTFYTFNIPWILQEVGFSLIFLIIDLRVDLRSNLPY